MGVTYHRDMVQGSDEWHAARCGLLTASEMHFALTPTLKVANNDKTRAHVYELAAQRLTKYVEPSYISDAMLRGTEDEAMALSIYCEKVGLATAVGFITNDKWGFTIGYSPDAIVGLTGLVEAKSRAQKYQMQVLTEHIATGATTIPQEHVLQCQTGLLVSEREWLDYISYCGGMPMAVIRIYPDREVQEAIVQAASEFELAVRAKLNAYEMAMASGQRLFPTERTERGEMILG